MSPEEKARRSKAGAEAREASKAHEKKIRDVLQTFEERRLISFYAHLQPRLNANPGRGKVFYSEPAGADFFGFFPNGATQWALEAKTVGWDADGDARRFALEKVSPLQQRHLWSTIHAGGPAILAVEFRDRHLGTQDFLIPWQDVPWRDRLSFTVDDVRPWVCTGRVAAALIERWNEWREESNSR